MDADDDAVTQAVTPGVTHVAAYHRPSYGHLLTSWNWCLQFGYDFIMQKNKSMLTLIIFISCLRFYLQIVFLWKAFVYLYLYLLLYLSLHSYFPLYLYLCRIPVASGDAIEGGAKPPAQPLQFLRHHSDSSQQIVSYGFVTYNFITIYFHISKPIHVLRQSDFIW